MTVRVTVRVSDSACRLTWNTCFFKLFELFWQASEEKGATMTRAHMPKREARARTRASRLRSSSIATTLAQRSPKRAARAQAPLFSRRKV